MKKFLLVIALLLQGAAVLGQNPAIFSNKKGAVNGYDVVAYFTDAKAVPGDAKYVADWNSVKWYFSSKEHLEAFRSEPEKYAPQFGGYCAYGTSQGYKVPTSPDAWTIVDGKLYLNYSTEVKKRWSKDRDALIEKANSNWPTLKNSTN